MAGTSLLSLIDDIASILDDVGTMAQMATEKTAGVLGDDLALNAEQVSGVSAERELPVVFAVAKGSFKNKLILVPAALAISYVVPQAITPLLMVGGLYLCFEGFEKIVHALFPHADDAPSSDAGGHAAPVVVDEATKIKGAIRTDFVLSAEIVTITLGTVADAPFPTQVVVVSGIAVLMTVGVYGLVGAIVKADDVGFALVRSAAGKPHARVRHLVGRGLLRAAPLLLRSLGVVGTTAMFLVGGGILMHGLAFVHHVVEPWISSLAGAEPSLVRSFVATVFDGVLGVLAGALAVVVVKVVGALRARGKGSQ